MKNGHSQKYLEKRGLPWNTYPILVVQNNVTHHKDVIPRIVQIEVNSKEYGDWLVRVHEERKADLERELLRTQLKIHAMETGDYSMMSQELVDELNKENEQLLGRGNDSKENSGAPADLSE